MTKRHRRARNMTISADTELVLAGMPRRAGVLVDQLCASYASGWRAELVAIRASTRGASAARVAQIVSAEPHNWPNLRIALEVEDPALLAALAA